MGGRLHGRLPPWIAREGKEGCGGGGEVKGTHLLREFVRCLCIVSGSPTTSKKEEEFSPGKAIPHLSEGGEPFDLFSATHRGDIAICSACLRRTDAVKAGRHMDETALSCETPAVTALLQKVPRPNEE